MTKQKKLLDYMIDGMYGHINRLEKELRIINGALYRIQRDEVVQGRYKNYTTIRLRQLKKELIMDIKEFKRQYNQLVYDVNKKHLKVLYIDSEIGA